MKLLKKFSIGFLVLIICFCSTIPKAFAYNEVIGEFNESGPPLSSSIGSATLTLYNHGSTSVPIGTTFWNSFPNAFGLFSTFNISYENFTHVKDDKTLINQDFSVREFGNWNYLLSFRDVYLLNDSYAFPRITFDITTTNYEQSFDFTWNAVYLDWDTGHEVSITESQAVQLESTDNRIWTYDMSSYFKAQFRLEDNDYDYVYIKELNIDIGHADSFSSNYATTLAINDMYIANDLYSSLETQFYTDISGVPTNSLFGWITNSLSAFLDTEIFPNFNLGTILGVIVAIPLLIYILKLFLGG